MRWLGVESATYDHATFSVSSNGSTWTTIWTHTGATLNDNAWIPLTYDISVVADNSPSVYMRWTMGTTDSSVVYCGWNIDDIEIWAESSGPMNTPTPAPPTNTPGPPTYTPTRTPTGAPTHTPTRTPTGAPTTPPTFTPTRTPTPPPTATWTPNPTSPPTFTPTANPTSPPSPTPTGEVPTATPTSDIPTATPTGCPETSISCQLNSSLFRSGDPFQFGIQMCNGDSTELNVDLYILLDVYGQYLVLPELVSESRFRPSDAAFLSMHHRNDSGLHLAHRVRIRRGYHLLDGHVPHRNV